MQFKKLVSKRIRHDAPGINLVADVNADISVNVAGARPERPKSSSPKSNAKEERRST
jgi:hypothetical protein